jgi:hypothetical protein
MQALHLSKETAMNVFSQPSPIAPSAVRRRPAAAAGGPGLCAGGALAEAARPATQWVGPWQQWADRLRGLASQGCAPFAAPRPALAA